jgi:hypothetical protein
MYQVDDDGDHLVVHRHLPMRMQTRIGEMDKVAGLEPV